jgi:hypothetical protein
MHVCNVLSNLIHTMVVREQCLDCITKCQVLGLGVSVKDVDKHMCLSVPSNKMGYPNLPIPSRKQKNITFSLLIQSTTLSTRTAQMNGRRARGISKSCRTTFLGPS